jgi:3'(2'), 5'-bisphosphate nucleotidase
VDAYAEDAAFAARVAAAAGDALLALRSRGELSGRDLGDAADRAADDLVLATLARERPSDAVLSEETPDDGARLAAARVWIVDPLDGTREYREGRNDWGVHVALVVAGEAVAGAVALPAQAHVFVSHPAPTVPSSTRTRPRVLVSRTRPPAFAPAVADEIGADLDSLGSAGAKAMAVVAADADAYLHSGGQSEWDSAAPVAVARAAGLHVSRVDGSALRYNQRDPRVDDLLICRPELAAPLLAAVARHHPAAG